MKSIKKAAIIMIILIIQSCGNDSNKLSELFQKKEIKADSVSVLYGPISSIVCGSVEFEVNIDNDTFGPTKAVGMVKVVIIRNITADQKERLGLEIGGAYLQEGIDKFQFIRKVDLNLTDQELSKQFGCMQ